MLITITKRDPIPKGYLGVDVTSHNQSSTILREGLSPFYLGPIPCYQGKTAYLMENVWQFSKVYSGMVDKNNNPTEDWFQWRDKGFSRKTPCRYPKGKQVAPLYSFWEVDGKMTKLGEIDARKMIYAPCYMKAVVQTPGYKKLEDLMEKFENIALIDFDGYNFVEWNQSAKDAMNRKGRFGHALMLYLLLTKQIQVQNDIIVDPQNILMPLL